MSWPFQPVAPAILALSPVANALPSKVSEMRTAPAIIVIAAPTVIEMRTAPAVIEMSNG